MKKIAILLMLATALTGPATIGLAQVAGSTLFAVSTTELRIVANGWSAKRQILGQAVYNDQDEKVGSVDDIIVAGDKSVSYAIVNAGGFLQVNKYDIAVPVSSFKLDGTRLMLPGATRDELKKVPRFEYAD